MPGRRSREPITSEGRLRIGHYTGGSEKSVIELEDRRSGMLVFQVEITPDQFRKIVIGSETVDLDITYHGLDLVGRYYHTDHFSFEMTPECTYDTPGPAVVAAVEELSEGGFWNVGEISRLRGSTQDRRWGVRRWCWTDSPDPPNDAMSVEPGEASEAPVLEVPKSTKKKKSKKGKKSK